MAERKNFPDQEVSHDPKDVERVWELMEQIRLCMLITRDGDKIRARPMSATPREPERAIYFLTDVSGHKDHEIEQDHSVCVTFSKQDDGKHLAVTGRARVLDDRPLIRDLWTPEAKAWWEGPEDPHIRVIEVTPEDAQYWEGLGGVVAWIAMSAAGLIGKTPDIGDQQKVDLH